MSRPPVVSVVLPFFDAPRQFLHEAIESVLAQSYERWELLLVDDGSSGECVEVARGFAKECPEQIRYLKHPGHENRGASASRTLGSGHALGRYVAFLDADDVWLPEKLAFQVAVMDSRPTAGMLYGNSRYWYSWTGKPADRGRDYLPDLGVALDTLLAPPGPLPRFLSGAAAVPPPCSVMVRGSALRRSGGWENTFRDMYDDQAFYAKMCLASPIIVVDACLDLYRQHAASICAVAQAEGRESATRLTYLRWLHDYLTSVGNTDEDLWKALENQLRRYDSAPLSRIHTLLDDVRRRVRKAVTRVRITETGAGRR